MFLWNILVHTFFIFALLFVNEIVGRRFNYSKRDEKGHMKKNNTTRTHRHLRLKHLNNNGTELGKRRQYLTNVNQLYEGVQQNVVKEPVLSQDNTNHVNQFTSSQPNDNSGTRSLPFLLSSGLFKPFETQKPLPIPYKKPDIRLVPKLYQVQYSKKPDVNVQHLHIHQGINPCQNGGLVVQTPGGYSCLCKKTHKGKHCQERDSCFPNPCKHGGNCIDLATHLQCVCSKSFKGLRCEDADSCDKNPCKHGATCLDLATGVQCICAVGYKGIFCTDVDFCNPNPCKNGGTCTEKNMAAVCQCANDHKGKWCEAKKVCSPNPCRNQGVCYEDRSSSPCVCAHGFTGTYCADNVCQPSPCLNRGACWFEKSTVAATWLPVCKCPNTFKGKNCEIPNPCAANPCKRGTCFDAYNAHHYDVTGNTFVCNCQRGYMGAKCDIRSCDKCDPNAKCLNEECVCNDGYRGNGHVCKKLPDPCIPNPCQNFGKCVAFDSWYDCRCPFSYGGSRCEQQI